MKLSKNNIEPKSTQLDTYDNVQNQVVDQTDKYIYRDVREIFWHVYWQVNVLTHREVEGLFAYRI